MSTPRSQASKHFSQRAGANRLQIIAGLHNFRQQIRVNS